MKRLLSNPRNWGRPAKVSLLAAGAVMVLVLANARSVHAQGPSLVALVQQIYDAFVVHDGKLDSHDASQTEQHQGQTGEHNALSVRLDTIETTLNNIATGLGQRGAPPVWDKVLASDDSADPCNSSRFTCVMSGAAVRDNETGLVWQRSLWSAAYVWSEARYACSDAEIGGRRGWRLPSVHELNSLVDPAITPGATPRVPANHPFSGIQTAANVHYWSATEFGYGSFTVSWWVDFGSWGQTGNSGQASEYPVWCVRGAMNSHEY